MRNRNAPWALLISTAVFITACGGSGTGSTKAPGGTSTAGTNTGNTSAPAPKAISKLKVGWCSKTLSGATAPFFIAKELGWAEEEGIDVQLVPMPGSGDCVQQTATGAVHAGVASIEPIAIGRQPGKGINEKVFYTAYQGNIYGIAVPVDSPIKELKDLKGKNIGVIGMNSGAVPVAKALVKMAGLDPEQDIKLVVAGEGAATAALLKNGSVQALSQFDTNYALVENAGIKLRLLPSPGFDAFPSNGFCVNDEWLKTHEKEAIALGRIYAKGTIFTIANPEAAIKILWKQNPDLKPTGKSEADAIKDEVHVLNARIQNWKLEKGGVKKWGESSVPNYTNYLKYMQDQGIISTPVNVDDVITNKLIDQINNFDVAKIQEAARNWK